MNEIIGGITVVVAVLTYLPYLRDTIRGKVTPHPFTWIIWVTLTAIAYAAQVSDNAGPGAWMNAAVLAICVFIILFSFKNGFDHITRFDTGVFGIGLLQSCCGLSHKMPSGRLFWYQWPTPLPISLRLENHIKNHTKRLFTFMELIFSDTVRLFWP